MLARRHGRFLGPLAIFKLEIAQRVGQPHQHAQLLMAHIETGERCLLVIALLGFHDEAVDVIRRPPDFQRETVLFVLRKVIEIDRHQLHEFHEFLIQLCLIVQPHRYRSGTQRYKAARNPTASPEYERPQLRLRYHPPAPDKLPQ